MRGGGAPYSNSGIWKIVGAPHFYIAETEIRRGDTKKRKKKRGGGGGGKLNPGWVVAKSLHKLKRILMGTYSGNLNPNLR